METGRLTSLICVSLLILETSVGVLASVYILIIMIFLNVYKKKNIKIGNKIRMALGLTNAFFSIFLSAGTFSDFLWPVTSTTTSASYVLYSFTMFCIISCSWLRAILSFFYFIKIINVKTKCFMWVKTNISPIVSWVILVAEIVSFGSIFGIFFPTVLQPTSSNASVSWSSAVPVRDLRRRFIYIIIVVTFVPLLTTVVTTITTTVVLIQHRLKMEQNMGPSAKLGAYKNAVFRILQSLIFFTMFYPVMLLFYLPVFEEMSPGFWASLLIFAAFTPFQAMIILLVNPKLNRAWKEILKNIRSHK